MTLTQTSILDYTSPSVPAAIHFDGATYDPQQDRARLTGQLQRVFDLLSDGQWWTLESLATVSQATTQSVSARIRDLRKDRFGAYVIERERVSGGLFQYRMVIPNSTSSVSHATTNR